MNARQGERFGVTCVVTSGPWLTKRSLPATIVIVSLVCRRWLI